MLWTPKTSYYESPYKTEADLESAILEVKHALFGPQRIYLDVKRKIGAKGKTNNIPDGYLIDLTSNKKPNLYVVENELSCHHPLKHIALQIMEFSFSFEESPLKVKNIIKEALEEVPEARQQCETYARAHGFDNIDYLLERMIYDNKFSALVIIDEVNAELQKALYERLSFSVEVITLKRYENDQGERVYEFDPFLADVTQAVTTEETSVDFSDLDTIVVPAREEGFQEVAMGENRWHHIRISGTMIPRIKYIAFYQTAPISAITHYAPVKSIEPWEDPRYYIVNFSEPLKEIPNIPLGPGSKRGVAPQASRYTSKSKLLSAKQLSEVF